MRKTALLLAVIMVLVTCLAGWSEYRTFTYDIPKTTGVHTLYITYDTGWSDLNINWLRFS